jgi:hypothetical protein
MVQLNKIFSLTRMVVFGMTSLFSLIVVIHGGLITNFSNTFLDNYAGLGIATGLLTMLTLPAMLALSTFRKGVFSSMIALEIGWIWFLWIMWLAVGGNSAGSFVFVGSCSRFLESNVVAACNESSAITAFGFLSWIMLMSYCSILFTLTFRQHLRGNTGVWTRDVTETDFTAVGANNNPQVIYDNKFTYPNQYPPAGSPIIPQQTPGSYTHAGVPYQAGSPNQPQAPGLYTQPQAHTGSFTHPQAQVQTGPNPYPQV